MTVYANSNFPGPLVTKNNVGSIGSAGINLIPIALLNTTAQTWTHNFGQTPLGMIPFINSNTNGGTPMPALNTCIMTSTNNTIVATPVASVNVLLLVVWSLPAGSLAGTPTSTFV